MKILLTIVAIFLFSSCYSQNRDSVIKKSKHIVIKIENDSIAKCRLSGIGVNPNEIYYITQDVIDRLNRCLFSFR